MRKELQRVLEKGVSFKADVDPEAGEVLMAEIDQSGAPSSLGGGHSNPAPAADEIAARRAAAAE
eukprot:14373643-Alexandrium_andersonii.AAC.1